MKLKAASGIILALLLLSMLTLALLPVKAAIINLKYHDDGPESYIAKDVGYGAAVRFTPPRRIKILEVGSKLAVESGTSNVPYKVHVYDASRNELITPVYDTTNGGWDWVDLSPYSLYAENDFYIALEWLEQFNPYIGCDQSNPDDRSWSIRFSDMYWYQSPDDHDWDYIITVKTDDQLCHLTIDSYPFDGIGIKVDGADRATPYSQDFEYGTNVSIEAKYEQIEIGGEIYFFDHWIEVNKYDFYSSDRIISYPVPYRGNARLEAIYIGETDVPWHRQETGINCGPASLEMVFDFYGSDISQSEIATVARTVGSGTNLPNMRRAAHFSDLSTEGGLTGYTARSLGYATFEYEPGTSWLGSLKSLIDSGYPIIVNTWYDESEVNGHYRVVVDYDDSDYAVRLHDPWDPATYGYGKYGGAFLRLSYDDFEDLWSRNNYWGLFVSPWTVEMVAPETVKQGDHFTINATTTYPCPAPFSTTHYPASFTEATLTLPSGFTLESGETPTIDIGDLGPGGFTTVSWHVIASNILGSHTITVTAAGTISEPSSPYSYLDRIGGFNSSTVEVTMRLPVHNLNTGLNYSSIQGAIDAPETLDGHTIFVETGTYYESPSIFLKDNITIIGESAASTIINGSISDQTCWYMTYKNLQVMGSITSGGADIAATDHNNIVGCVIHSGLFVAGSYHTVKNNTIEGGLSLLEGDVAPGDNVIENNVFVGSGIRMNSAGRRHVITRNTITNAPVGLNARSVGWNSWTHNNIRQNRFIQCETGMQLYAYQQTCEYNDITENQFVECGTGVHLETVDSDCDHNDITENQFVECGTGVHLFTSSWTGQPVPSNSTISSNTFEDCGYGIFLQAGMEVSIYHNNFLNNTIHAHTNPVCNNTWDNGYPSGGNYWSNYTGVDFFSGAYQNETGSDGIGDTPYVVDGDNQDDYPLMNPWTQLSGLGDCDGDYEVDYDDFIILAGAYGTSVGEAGYHARADLDNDGDVDYDDFITLAGAYGTSEGDPLYNQDADVNRDGNVDYYDFIWLAGNYGETL